MTVDDFWRQYVNGLGAMDNIPDYEEPPLVEEEAEEYTDLQREVLDKDAAVLRLRFDVYLISPIGDAKKAYTVNSNQAMEDLGVMSIRDTLKMIKRRQRKKS